MSHQQQQQPLHQDRSELNETQQLQLSERANEIYRQQMKYMQDHLASLRSLIQDKENIIENLMLRYDLGIITQDQNRQGGNLSPDEIEMEELRRKAEALAQRTILENFELREVVNELRDENFHLRNEIYELQEKMDSQVLQINKLEKNAKQNRTETYGLKTVLTDSAADNEDDNDDDHKDDIDDIYNDDNDDDDDDDDGNKDEQDQVIIKMNNTEEVDDDDILYNKHRDIIKRWNENAKELEQISSLNEKILIESTKTDNDDDEKKEEKKDNFGVILFDKYCECYSIINEQTIRLNQVTTDKYLVELLNHQQTLSKSLKENQGKLPSEDDNYDKSNKEYEEIKQQRIRLRDEIVSMVEKCNKMIKKENELFKELQQGTKKKNKINQEIEKLKRSSKTCLSVINLYNDFMENNNKYINAINENFDKLWKQFEAKWMQWTATDITIWFRYKTIKIGNDKIEWINIENELKTRNISGKLLAKFNDLTFELIGLKDFEIVNHLISHIEILKKNYKDDKAEGDINKDKVKNKEIPKEFICPITKNIMQDPVMAFDGYTYERNAIQSYLKINNKSPVTGIKADYMIVFPNHKLKEQIQIYIKENDIQIELQNDQSTEGRHTAYL